MKVDAQTKVSDIVSIITKQHPVDDVENYALVTVIDVRAMYCTFLSLLFTYLYLYREFVLRSITIGFSRRTTSKLE